MRIVAIDDIEEVVESGELEQASQRERYIYQREFAASFFETPLQIDESSKPSAVQPIGIAQIQSDFAHVVRLADGRERIFRCDDIGTERRRMDTKIQQAVPADDVATAHNVLHSEAARQCTPTRAPYCVLHVQYVNVQCVQKIGLYSMALLISSRNYRPSPVP